MLAIRVCTFNSVRNITRACRAFRSSVVYEHKLIKQTVINFTPCGWSARHVSSGVSPSLSRVPSEVSADIRVLTRYRVENNIHDPEQWYQVTAKSLRAIPEGSAVLKRWGGSASLAVMQNLPPPLSTGRWLPWLFVQLPRVRFSWTNPENQREYCDWMLQLLTQKYSSDLSLSPGQHHEIWYQASISDIIDNKGATLAFLFQLNLYKLLQHVYAEYEWDGWRFKQPPKHYWTALASSSNLKPEAARWVEEAEKRCKIDHVSEWYRVSREQLAKHFRGFPKSNWTGVLGNLLGAKYPESVVRLALIQHGSKMSGQRQLAKLAQQLLGPAVSIIEDAVLAPGITASLLIPERKVAINLTAPDLEAALLMCRREGIRVLNLTADAGADERKFRESLMQALTST